MRVTLNVPSVPGGSCTEWSRAAGPPARASLAASSAVNAFGFAMLAFVAASAVVLLTAACRIYLGYHWATDALASIALSLVVLGIVIAVDTWRTVRVGTPSEVHASEATRKEDGSVG